jgi:hypothetical protein
MNLKLFGDDIRWDEFEIFLGKIYLSTTHVSWKAINICFFGVFLWTPSKNLNLPHMVSVIVVGPCFWIFLYF